MPAAAPAPAPCPLPLLLPLTLWPLALPPVIRVVAIVFALLCLSINRCFNRPAPTAVAAASLLVGLTTSPVPAAPAAAAPLVSSPLPALPAELNWDHQFDF